MEEKTVISFANVAAAYDNATEVLSDVSFNISGGAFYFLSGASGAGKTTLLRLIYQLHKPLRGQIKLFGKNTGEMTRDDITNLHHKMAIVFQEYSLLSHMTVFDNVALPLRVRGISEDKVKKLVAKVLDWVGLGKYADVKPMELSGGQQHRQVRDQQHPLRDRQGHAQARIDGRDPARRRIYEGQSDRPLRGPGPHRQPGLRQGQ